MPETRLSTTRRGLLAAAASAALLPREPRAQAPAYPTRAVRCLVPFPPGGAIDALARLTAQQLSVAWGQPVTVENRPGAGGVIGTEALARSAPDGYTLGWGAVGTHGLNAALYRKLPYDPIGDFAPVAAVASVPNLLVVHPSLPVRSVRELVALLREAPTPYAYASAGSGTTLHLSCELFKTLADVKMLHVPYKGSGPALTDVMAGQVPIMCDSVTSALPAIKAGRLRVLGITSKRRSSVLPDVPTLAEAGVAGYEMDPWFGVFAPAGTPEAIVAEVNGQIRRMLAQADVRTRLQDIGAEPIGGDPRQFAVLVRADLDRWGRLIRELGITAD